MNEVAQSCPTLCDPMDCSLPGFSVHGILLARILEWVTISFPGDLPDSGIEPRSPTLEADALTTEPPGKPWILYFYIWNTNFPITIYNFFQNYFLESKKSLCDSYVITAKYLPQDTKF